MNWKQIKFVASHDLRQLWQSPDFWGPMLTLGFLFFTIIPLVTLAAINVIGKTEALQQVSQAIDILPAAAKQAIPKNTSPETQVSYTIAVFLMSPIAIIVPLTISVAVGASSIVGEREKGTGEFLAHSPLGEREIFLGKLVSAFLPGYFTTIVGFTVYSFLVNLMLSDEVGYWFFPTPAWIVMIVWILPPFLLLGLSFILRISNRVRSTTAAQQASSLVTIPLILVAYGQVSGSLVGAGSLRSSIVFGIFVWFAAVLIVFWAAGSIRRSRLLGVANED